MEFISDIVRSIFLFVDAIIYPMAAFLYQLFTDLTKIMLFSTEDVTKFTSRIYLLIGIVMMFKVGISLISMYVTPDTFYNEKTGVGNLVKNVMIVLILLALTPQIFQQAFKIQYIVINNNLIPKIILGSPGIDGDGKSDPKATGNRMVGSVFLGFYEPGINEAATTNEILAGDYDGLVKENLNEKEGGDYINLYRPMFSTIAGIFVIWILITFCFDIAIRSVKLGLLQLIAPIPILMSLDPKGGKQKLDSWVKVTVNTFLSLFIKVAIINFGVYLISLVAQLQYGQVQSDGTVMPMALEGFDGALTATFLILGILMFVSEAPKLLEDLLGIKLKGKLDANPFGKVMKDPTVAAAAGVTGSVAGFAAGKASQAVGAAVGGIDAGTNGRSIFRGMREGSNAMKEKKGFDALNFRKAQTTKPLVLAAERKRQEAEAQADYERAVNPNNDIKWNDISNAGYSEEFSQSIQRLDGAEINYGNIMAELSKNQLVADRQQQEALKNNDVLALREAKTLNDGLLEQMAKEKQKLETAKSEHEEIRKQFADDAKREDVFRKTTNSEQKK